MNNTSGITPTGHMILIKTDKVEEKTAGGIILPSAHLDRENASAQKGVIVARGPTAGDFIDWPEGFEYPAEGARVLVKKFAGVEVQGDDGADYRVCEDKDVLAILGG